MMDDLEPLTHRADVDDIEIPNPIEVNEDLTRLGAAAPVDAAELNEIGESVSTFYDAATDFTEDVEELLDDFTAKLQSARYASDVDNDYDRAHSELDDASGILNELHGRYEEMVKPLHGDAVLVQEVEETYGTLLEAAQTGYRSSQAHVVEAQSAGETRPQEEESYAV
jgi:DNA repair ATPase RecN